MTQQNFDFKKVQKKIQQKNHRRGILLVFSAVLVTILLFLAVPKVLNQFFYNPTGQNAYVEGNQYIFDRQIYNELTIPDYDMTDLTMEQTGIGTYQINETYRSKYSNQTIGTKTFEIKRNKLYLNNSDFHYFTPTFSQEMLPSNQLADTKVVKADTALAKSNLRENIKPLPKSTYVNVNLVFKADKSISAYQEWLKLNTNNVNTLWQAVRPSQKTIDDTNNPVVVGFNPAGGFSGIGVGIKNEKQLNDDFPLLISHLADTKQNQWSEEKRQTTHFKSLLQYLIKNESFLAQDPSKIQAATLKNVLADVNKNGLKIYGVTLYLPAFELEKILTDDAVKSATVTKVDVFPLTSQSGQLPGFTYPPEE